MVKKDSLSKNYIYQFLYQILILFIPLILSPYLTRTLRETALGIYSYVDSIAAYFVAIAMLGISRHGQRVISECTEEITLRKTFWSLFSVHAIISLAVLVAYICFIFCFAKDNQNIFIIESLYVFSALFDITWLFYGLENFKSIVIKNALVKIFQCASIFCLIKSADDLWLYTLIMSLGILAGQAVMLPQAVRLIKPIRFSWEEAKVHIKPLLVFSISVIASFLYTVFDKTLLGLLSTKENVAFYEYSNKIINIPKTIVGVTGTVMFPRACRLATKGDVEGQKRYINYSYLISAFISMASLFGLLSVADLFATVYFGDNFAICGRIMMLMSPLVCIVGIGDIIRTQYMIPNHMDKQFNICILLNAILNIVLTLLLIPKLGVYGAVIGSVSAETFGLINQTIICRRFIKIKDLLRAYGPFFIIGMIMFTSIKMIGTMLPYNYFGLLVEIAIGAVVYSIITFLYFLIWHRDILNSLMRIIFATHKNK